MTRIGRNGISLSLRSAMPAAAIVISGGCTSAPTLQPYTEIVPGSVRDLDMLAIPGGTITIKDPENAGRTRSVEVGPFWIATYEITWDQYDPFVFEDMEPDWETERDADAFSRPSKPDIPPDLVTQSERAAQAEMLTPRRYRHVAGDDAETPAIPADSFSAGDRVRHPKFGEGIVVSSEPSGMDYQVVIAFQGEAGIKKLLLSFAPLEKIEA